jgi:uncharacterized membrane protein YagU involved in acid resistance
MYSLREVSCAGGGLVGGMVAAGWEVVASPPYVPYERCRAMPMQIEMRVLRKTVRSVKCFEKVIGFDAVSGHFLELEI